MVESSQLGRFWPHLYEPLRGLGTRLSEWLAPASEASSDDNLYRISIELPGVSEDGIDLRITNDSLIVSGKKLRPEKTKARHGISLKGNMAPFAGHFAFLRMLTPTRLKHMRKMVCSRSQFRAGQLNPNPSGRSK